MAGYIGSKTVNLSTTGADIVGDADVSGDLTVDTNTLYVDSTNNRVGLGTSLPSDVLHVVTPTFGGMTLECTGATADPTFKFLGDSGNYWSLQQDASQGDSFQFRYNNSEKVRITSTGQTLIGRTTTSGVSDGHRFDANGFTQHVRDGGSVLELSRETSDGDIAVFKKGTTTVGSIGNLNANTIYIQGGNTFWGAILTSPNSNGNGVRLIDNNLSVRKFSPSLDNVYDLGGSSDRFDDVYATNGTIQTSDRNEKQDIAELSDAEQRVAVAAKGLMRKFRWRDAVAEKGDDARTHFGIIAQDLQAAFVAEGLDAGDYAMFISSTWWEHDVEVPAVEAVAEVLDEDGNVVTEAVEAADAYTRTDTYETQEEAPEGATERTRLGVRYSELLAFIIGAL